MILVACDKCGTRMDTARLTELVAANVGRRGFTFTHRHRSRQAMAQIRWANRAGFTINASADSLEEADRLADYEIGPVAVVVPSTTSDRGLRTPAGRKVVVCPAQTKADLTCATCRLCAIPSKKAIVAFRSHGQSRARVDDLVMLRTKRQNAGKPEGQPAERG